jgi:predicted tellurium resistance membrane protein TerC
MTFYILTLTANILMLALIYFLWRDLTTIKERLEQHRRAIKRLRYERGEK